MHPDLQRLLNERFGAARLVEIARAGIPQRTVNELVASGELVKLQRGVVQRPTIAAHWAQLRVQGIDVTCVTAARSLKLWVLDPHRDEFHVSYRRMPLRDDVLQARDRPRLISHRRRTDNRTLDVILHAMHCLSEVEALVIAESAVVLKQVSLAEVRAASAHFVAERAIVDMLQPGSMSLLETVGRFHLVKAGHIVQIQRYFERWGHIDGLIDGVLGIEFDGRESHDTPQGYQEDRRRNNMSVLHGVPTLRVTYDQVVHRPQEFIALVEEALKRIHGGKFP